MEAAASVIWEAALFSFHILPIQAEEAHQETGEGDLVEVMAVVLVVLVAEASEAEEPEETTNCGIIRQFALKLSFQ